MLFSDTWNYRIETFLVTRKLLLPLSCSFYIHICRAWKLHPRASSRDANYFARAAACGNNFPDFPAVARAFCREAINFFSSHSLLTVTCRFLPSLSLFLCITFGHVTRSLCGIYLVRNYVLQYFLVPRKADFLVYFLQEKFLYKNRSWNLSAVAFSFKVLYLRNLRQDSLTHYPFY